MEESEEKEKEASSFVRFGSVAASTITCSLCENKKNDFLYTHSVLFSC